MKVEIIHQGYYWNHRQTLFYNRKKSKKLKAAFCHIALYSRYINFGFNRGAELTPTSVILSGKGKLIRHLRVTDYQTFPGEKIKSMIWEAVGISEQLNPALLKNDHLPKSIVMSISEKKIRPTKLDK